eukprot:g65850.t1
MVTITVQEPTQPASFFTILRVWYNGQELTEVAGARLAVAVDASAGPRGLRLSCKSTTNTSEWGSAAGTVRSNAGGVWALGLTTDNPPSGWPTSAFDMVANAFAPPTFTAGSLLVDVLDSSADTAWPADNRYGYFLFGTPSPSCSPSPSVTPTISLTASSSVPPSISPTASPSSSRAASVSTSPVPSTTTSASASAVSPSVTSSVSLTASQSSVSLTASVTQSISESSSQSSSPSAVSTSISISPSRCPPCPHLAKARQKGKTESYLEAERDADADKDLEAEAETTEVELTATMTK